MKTIIFLLTLILSSSISFAQNQQPPMEEKKEEHQASQDTDEKKTRIGMSAHLSLANKAKFSNLTATNGTTSATGEAEFSTQSALGVGVNLMSSKAESWGFSGSLFYEFDREIDSLKLTDSTGSTTYNYNSPKPKISFIVAEGNLLYRWKNVYVPFGLNASSPTFTSGVGATGTLEVKGGLGAQVGIGVFINEDLSFQLVSRSIAIRINGKNGSTTYDYGTGYMTGISLGLQYWFK